MYAVHIPARALRLVASFLRVEFDVFLRDGRLPFVCDELSRVFACRGVSGRAAGGRLIGAPARVAPAGVRGALCEVVNLSDALGLPLALVRFKCAEEALEEASFVPALMDLSSFPPLQRAAVQGSFGNSLLRDALAAVLAGSWSACPSAGPGVLAAADMDLRGLRLFWLDVGRPLPRLLRILSVPLDDFLQPDGAVRVLCDPTGHFVYAAVQGLQTVTCLKVCARSGTVAASLEAPDVCPGASILPLAPDLWLHLAGEDTALLSTCGGAPRPQREFWRAACGATPAALHTPWRMSGGRLVVADVLGGRLLLADLGGPGGDLRLRAELRDSATVSALHDVALAPVSEGPAAERLILRARHGQTVLVREVCGPSPSSLSSLRADVVSGVALCSESVEHPLVAAVFAQAHRQQERRVAAAAAAALCAPLSPEARPAAPRAAASPPHSSPGQHPPPGRTRTPPQGGSPEDPIDLTGADE